MSSYDGSRSARQSKRYSVTALYLSISANERDLEIEDDLARGTFPPRYDDIHHPDANWFGSSENSTRFEGEDLLAIEEELRAGKGCQIS
jgi:hypothetical protein